MAEQKTTIVSSEVANPLPNLFPHAVKAGGLVFVSGSIGLDVDNKMVEGGIQEHTHQIIKNFKHVLQEAGSGLDKIVKINIYLTDMKNFAPMNEVYMQYFNKGNFPGRTCVAVKQLPFDTDVEMECTALA